MELNYKQIDVSKMMNILFQQTIELIKDQDEDIVFIETFINYHAVIRSQTNIAISDFYPMELCFLSIK